MGNTYRWEALGQDGEVQFTGRAVGTSGTAMVRNGDTNDVLFRYAVPLDGKGPTLLMNYIVVPEQHFSAYDVVPARPEAFQSFAEAVNKGSVSSHAEVA